MTTKEPKKPKHHRICMKCRVQSTGKSVKECIDTFPVCGLDGGKINDACKTTILQDGTKAFELISASDLAKLQKAAEPKQAKPNSTPKNDDKNTKNSK